MSSPRTALPGPSAGGGGALVAQTAQRLRVEFAGALDPATITRVVRGCHRDLAAAPAAALPELVERRARVGLTDLTTTADTAAAERHRRRPHSRGEHAGPEPSPPARR